MTKPKKKKRRLTAVKKKLITFYEFLKKCYYKVKEFFSNKYVKISLSILLAVMFMLGFSTAWECGDKGNTCSGGYNPPNPNDVNKLIRPGRK